ncbi:hypothetical protein B566_EDAN005606 [Ephemera danica]|nr:hypothetical protein B566_EDAN005606 [Ephemera danica]
MISTESIICAAELGRTNYSRVDPRVLQYGTAGFREKAQDLSHVLYRMGLLAAIRSTVAKGTVGIMVTASHNPVADNGVKLVDPSGEMLVAEWEDIATTLANARPSSDSLASAAKEGAEILGAIVKDFGVVTTPELHFVTAARNAGVLAGSVSGNYEPIVAVDGANGVGALKIKLIQPRISQFLTLNLINEGDGELNHLCGADFVKVQQKAPKGLEGCKQRGASLDGDADRIIYFYHDDDGTFHMLDGDKIATLVAGYLQELVTKSGLSLNLGIVQTAYANGSSTTYISEQLKVPVACVPTGVKHLHHKAGDFDIGVYFEANGHGTVLFSNHAREQVQNENNMINQNTGDALADLLLVELILHARGWSARDWDNAYTDLPNRQLKVKVKDRRVVTTTDAERKCVTPAGLQDRIHAAATSFPRGRAFVRPSGTEDVVRVYAEAATQREADQLANQVAQATFDLAGGTQLSLIPLE